MDYVDRCLCGYFVTQEDINQSACPECGRNITNLTEQWTQVEELAQPQVTEITAQTHPEVWETLQPPQP